MLIVFIVAILIVFESWSGPFTLLYVGSLRKYGVFVFFDIVRGVQVVGDGFEQCCSGMLGGVMRRRSNCWEEDVSA